MCICWLQWDWYYHDDRKWWVNKQSVRLWSCPIKGLDLWRIAPLTLLLSDWPSPRGHTCRLAEPVSLTATRGLVSISPLTSITDDLGTPRTHWPRGSLFPGWAVIVYSQRLWGKYQGWLFSLNIFVSKLAFCLLLGIECKDLNFSSFYIFYCPFFFKFV